MAPHVEFEARATQEEAVGVVEGGQAGGGCDLRGRFSLDALGSLLFRCALGAACARRAGAAGGVL